MTQEQRPKVTIAIPTLDRLSYLQLALNSALAQTYPDLEIVVANNASSDGTTEYLSACSDPRVRVLHHVSRLSMVDNWNSCVAASTGEFLLLLSDDDLLRPTAIEKMVNLYGSPDDPDAPGFVYGGGSIIDAAGHVTRNFSASPTSESGKDLTLAFFSAKRDLWLCGILFRKSSLCSGFSSDYLWAPDTKAWIGAAFERPRIAYANDSIVDYRVHHNITSNLPVDIWCRELEALTEFAITTSQAASGPDPSFARELRRTTQDMIARSLPVRINAMMRSDKRKALHEYWKRRATMLCSPERSHFFAGVIFLFLPNQFRSWLGRNLRRLRSSRS